ncbi:MAG TPA: primosomal protein N' [Flavobacteriales bacterium]|nr:primosomal protein N' [Flavobacteriales bacterium]|tara:strand:- start:48441 stop:50909 length:2469 start_codon:yes stop_codon:yes gene_type:complete
MERVTKFVQVIVPLSLKGELTYRVPNEWNDLVLVGQRVIVQIGRTKLYTALISAIHETAPLDYQVKYIDYLLDEEPIVTQGQLKFWSWISTYYMCSIGEVMNAALPGSFKLASETQIVLASSDRPDYEGLNSKEVKIVEALEATESLYLKDISTILDIKTVMPVINGLVKKGLIVTLEELKERVKPKLKSYVEFTDYSVLDSNRMEILDDLQRRAFKQLELFMTFLKMQDDKKGLVTKKDLLEYSGISDSTLNALREKNILRVTKKEISRIDAHGVKEVRAILSEAQSVALKSIRSVFEEKDTCLLHGVTSSGKTEVYCELIEEQISQNRTVLFLVPEIALTTQLIGRLRKRFGDIVGVFHSKFNQGQRSEVWNDSLKSSGERFKIFIGARSALFLPLKRLGLIIVDEEHDASFKQYDPAPRYNARDLSLVLAHIYKAKTILGSATPSIESYYNAQSGKYGLVELNERFGKVSLPKISTVDLRNEIKNKTIKEEFSSVLLDEMSKTLKKGEQVILFQNRRGYSPVWQCVTCGNVPQCVRCDVSLTYHKPINSLKCHYCGYQLSPAPQECDVCSSNTYKMVGFGTQKLEENLGDEFPEAQVQRMDFDTTRTKNSYETIIEELETGYTDILVGTQMVSKGLDFKNVGLVGVVQADQMLRFPDFRAFERSFQLMTQVAGRAGRREKEGKVVIQTYYPDHRIIQSVIKHDFLGFYNTELLERRKYSYPPFSRLIRLTVRHKKIEEVNSLSKELVYDLKGVFREMVLGPEFPAVIRIQNMYLKNILIKFDREHSPAVVKAELTKILDRFKSDRGKSSFRIKIDVDPA